MNPIKWKKVIAAYFKVLSTDLSVRMEGKLEQPE
jgi:hypothetical protein